MDGCKLMKTIERTNRPKNEGMKALCDALQTIGSDRDNFQNFLQWFSARWQPGATLEKIDPESPWSPDNAYWDGGLDPDGWTEIWSQAYAKTRAPVKDPCPGCKLDPTCVRICPRKAKYWDKITKKLKRMMNDVHGKRD